MGLDTKPLVDALQAFQAAGGLWAELERDTAKVGQKISAATIGRTAASKTTARAETWEILHRARPDFIPRPPWIDPYFPKKYLGCENDPSWVKARAEWEAENLSQTKVPLIAYVSAGEPFQWTDGGYGAGEGFEMIDYPLGVPPVLGRNLYAVRIRGKSMFPYLKDGAILFVKPESREYIRHGDYVIWKDKDYNAWVKMVWFTKDKIIFKSMNPDYPDITEDPGDVILMERVIAIRF
ncbi:MAG: S24 family peptidase [Desulforudis sp.]|nr:MAG: S24 family peptidase [Desulforudis sp.]